MDEELLRDLETVMGKRISMADSPEEQFPRWSDSERIGLLLYCQDGGLAEIEGSGILAYHLGLKVVDEAGIEADISPEWYGATSDWATGVEFWLPKLKGIKVQRGTPGILRFASREPLGSMPRKSAKIEMLYHRTIARLDDALKNKRDLIASVCDVLKEHLPYVLFKSAEYVQYGNDCSDPYSSTDDCLTELELGWKVPRLNVRNYRRVARVLKELERTIREYSK